MEQIILVGHLLVALAIIGLIMIQQGKGSDIGASFGAGGSQTLFGSTGTTNVLTRATAWLVAIFFATSFGLAMIADSRTTSSDDLGFELPFDAAETAPAEAPVMEIPSVEIPETSMEAMGSAAGEDDLPAVEGQDVPAGIDSDDELPEG